jgi:hypothetical protein
MIEPSGLKAYDLAAEPGRSEILPQLPYKPGPLRVNDVDCEERAD